MTAAGDSGVRRLLMLHGWGLNRRVFDGLAEVLPQGVEALAFDLPGHGQSPWRGESFEVQIQCLQRALPDGDLLGWSMGGLYAIELARRHPQRFPRLLLVASNPCFVQRPDWPCAVDAGLFDAFAGELVSDWQATIRRFIGLQLQGDRGQRTLIRQVTTALREGGAPQPEALQAGLELLKRHDARAALSCLPEQGVQVRVLLGGLDRLVPPVLAGELPRLAAPIGVECWPRSAHAPFLSDPDAFAAWIRQSAQPAASGQGGGAQVLQSLRR